MVWDNTHFIIIFFEKQTITQGDLKNLLLLEVIKLELLFFDKKGYLDIFEYLIIPLDICNPPFHTYQVFTVKNLMRVAPRC